MQTFSDTISANQKMLAGRAGAVGSKVWRSQFAGDVVKRLENEIKWAVNADEPMNVARRVVELS